MLAEELERYTPASVATQVPLGDPATEIAKVADGVAAGVLVVGVSERSFVSRALFGTTGARLVRSSRIPILAVPRAAAATVRERVHGRYDAGRSALNGIAGTAC